MRKALATLLLVSCFSLVAKPIEVPASGDSKDIGEKIVREIEQAATRQAIPMPPGAIVLSPSTAVVAVDVPIESLLPMLLRGVGAFPEGPYGEIVWSDESPDDSLTRAGVSQLLDFTGIIGTFPRGEAYPRMRYDQQQLNIELDLANPLHRAVYPKEASMVIRHRDLAAGYPAKASGVPSGNGIYAVLRENVWRRILWREGADGIAKTLSRPLVPSQSGASFLQAIVLGRLDLDDIEYFAIADYYFISLQSAFARIAGKVATDFPHPPYFVSVMEKKAILAAFYNVTGAAGVPVYRAKRFAVSLAAGESIELSGAPLNAPISPVRHLSHATIQEMLNPMLAQIGNPNMNLVYRPGEDQRTHARRFQAAVGRWQREGHASDCLSALVEFEKIVNEM